MNLPYLHLLLNHVPILATFFGVCILLFGFFAKQFVLQKAGFVFFIFAALVSMAAMQTGEAAEELIENMPTVSKTVIHEHEEAAELANYCTIASGILGLLALFIPASRKPFGRVLAIGTLVIGLFSFALLARTGLEGGKIIHKEMHEPANSPDTPVEIHQEHEH